jgi:hypothetical protein
MQYETNMRGVLFKNTEKRDGKRDPDYRGNVEIDRVQYWVDAWINSSKDGTKKFMSLSFKPKQAAEYEGASRNPSPKTQPSREFDDAIPF